MKTESNLTPDPPADNAAWRKIVLQYQKPSLLRALWQIIDTLVPYGLLWYLMYVSLAISWWLVVPLAVLAGAFLVRMFIIFIKSCDMMARDKDHPKAADKQSRTFRVLAQAYL